MRHPKSNGNRARRACALTLSAAAAAGAAALTTVMASPARADTWTNFSGNAFWSSGANWLSFSEPHIASSLSFNTPFANGAPTIIMSLGEAAGPMAFHDSYTLSPGSITLGAATPGVPVDIDVDTKKTVTVQTAVTCDDWDKVGAGTVVLTSNDNNILHLDIQAGVVRISDFQQISEGDGFNPWRATLSGGTLAITQTTSVAGGGLIYANGGTIDVAAGCIATVSVADVSAGAGGAVTKSGAGVLDLRTASGRSGPTTVTGGGVVIAHDDYLGSGGGGVTLAGGTLANTQDTSSVRPFTMGSGGGTFETVTDRTFTIDSSIGGSGSLTKTGGGTLRLTGVNTYGGGTTLRAGRLEVSLPSGLGSGPLMFEGGALGSTLQSVSLSQPVVVGAERAFIKGGSAFLDGVVSGSGSVTVEAGAGLRLNNAANTFTGPITVEEPAMLSVASTESLGTGANPIVVNGGTLTALATLSISRPLQVNDGTVAVNGSATLTVNAGIGGIHSKTGSGTLLVAGGTAGGTTVKAGLLKITSPQALANGFIRLEGSGIFEVAGATSDNQVTLSDNGMLRGLGTAACTGLIHVDNAVSPTISSSPVGGNTFTIGNQPDDLHSFGATTIKIAGLGTVRLPFANPGYLGGWRVDDGTLRIENGAALGGSGSVVQIQVANAATLELGGATLSRNMALNPGSTLRGTGSAAYLGTASLLDGGTVTLATGTSTADTLSIGDPSHQLTAAAGSLLRIGGSGTVRFPSGNAFSGDWQVDGGTFRVDVATSAGPNPASVVTVNNGGALEVADLAWGRAVTLNHGATLRGTGAAGYTATATVAAGASVTLGTGATPGDVLSFSAPGALLAGGTGDATVHVVGAGIVRMNSAAHTFSGSWSLDGGGTLEVPGNGALAAPANGITFNGGTLRALGAVSGSARAVTVTAAGGTIDTNGVDAAFGNVTGPPAAGTIAKRGAGNLTVNHLRIGALSVEAGRVTIVASGGAPSGASRLSALTIGAGATLDLRDNKLLVAGAGGDAGAFDGTRYGGLTGAVASAHNGGGWDGPGGITTSMPDAPSGLTTIAVATADETSYTGGNFGGISVGGGDVLLMYTYAGDANLDGIVSGDDYSSIDFNILVPGAYGWFNGDFNYDGIVSGDDYSSIDFNVLAQGAPFPTTGTPSGARDTVAVPEPASTASLLAAAGLLAPRRRRHRH